MAITIKDFALELAISNPKEVVEKAKEMGISVKNISSEISDEDALKLSDYIMSGKLPASAKKASTPKEKTSKTSESKSTKSEKLLW